MIDEWINAWMNSDNIKIGKLLNYPDCCIDFFQKYWVEEKFIDTTYPMSLNGTNGPKECNILLRWLGVRAVSHLPCSFSCERTYEQALKNIEFGRYLGFNEEMDWLEEMLSWPVQWSALHGIAEIKTPILKISTRTDATADLVVVNKEGFVYPEEGVSGNKFPYINKSKTHLTKTMSFKKSILLDKLWRDNGFYSFEAMECSHKVILDLVKNFFKEKVPVLSVSDFGCGNGYLLKKLSELKIADKYRFFGCELDFNRYKNIDIVMKGVENVEYQFECRNMYDESYYPEVMKETDLDIITSGRFFEVPEETAIKFIREFAKKPERILVIYSYSDRTHELKGPQTLELLKKAGFTFEMLDKNENMGCLAYLGKLKPITSKKLELKVL
ncbi:MAG: DUF483 domain-containing protein [Patescibacteria group bacterium]|nr:DUF483 domain-containing protein [Patescibacteria group bacterium]